MPRRGDTCCSGTSRCCVEPLPRDRPGLRARSRLWWPGRGATGTRPVGADDPQVLRAYDAARLDPSGDARPRRHRPRSRDRRSCSQIPDVFQTAQPKRRLRLLHVHRRARLGRSYAGLDERGGIDVSSGSKANAGTSGAIYGLGIFGAWFYYWQQADRFWEYLYAISGSLLARLHGLPRVRCSLPLADGPITTGSPVVEVDSASAIRPTGRVPTRWPA